MLGMMTLVNEAGLPFTVYETGRHNDRQAWLYQIGRTREKHRAPVTNIQADGPHGGDAFDVLLDWSKIDWSGETGLSWELGLSEDRKVIKDRKVFRYWFRLGQLWKRNFADCMEWGGTWVKKHEGRVLIGWDPYHFEMRTRDPRGTLKELR